VSLLPTLVQLTGSVYFFGALVLGLGYSGMSLLLLREPSHRVARALFFTSIIYLPLLLTLMVVDKSA